MPDIVGIVQACEAGPGGDWDESNWNQVSWPVPGANGDTFACEGDVSQINGAMVATETGDDTFLATGEAVETGVMYAVETGDDVLAATGYVAVEGAMAAQETGSDVLAATGEVVAEVAQRGGYGKDYRKPRQREFGNEVTARKRLREQIRDLVEPIKSAPAATLLVAQGEGETGIAVMAAGHTVKIPVPPQIDANRVTRMVTQELARQAMVVRTQRAAAALETMMAAERERVARLRREEDELLLLA
jgi:hypothetical protein